MAIYLIAYAGLHSLLTTVRIKSRIDSCCPGFSRFYRSTYSVVSIVTPAPLLGFLKEGALLYSISGWAREALFGLQMLSAIGFLYAARAIALGEFLGYRPLLWSVVVYLSTAPTASAVTPCS